MVCLDGPLINALMLSHAASYKDAEKARTRLRIALATHRDSARPCSVHFGYCVPYQTFDQEGARARKLGRGSSGTFQELSGRPEIRNPTSIFVTFSFITIGLVPHTINSTVA